MRLLSPLLMFLVLSLVTGCGALSSLSEAGKELDAYTLSPATTSGADSAGSRHLVVELPTSAGALGTDRILIKPIRFQAQYLPDGRWSETAPALVQTLLIASFQNLGGFRLIGRTGAGLMPDYTLMTELQEFQAEPLGTETAQFTVKVSVMMTLIRESDRRIVASRRFAGTATVGSDDTLAIVDGFDRALKAILLEAHLWTKTQAG